MVNVIVVGDAKVGKSTLCHLMSEEYNERLQKQIDTYYPTIGVDFVSQETTPSGLSVILWDTSGQTKFLQVLEQYLNSCHVVLLCFDLSRKETFDSLPIWFDRCCALNKTVFLVGCKMDIADSIITIEDIGKYADDIGANYYPTSSKKKIGLTDLRLHIDQHLDMIEKFAPIDLEQTVAEIRPQIKKEKEKKKKQKQRRYAMRKLFCCLNPKGYVVFDQSPDENINV